MQHHNELQTTVCGSIVLDHLLSMRVIKTTDGRAACKLTLLEYDHYQLLHAAPALMFTKEMSETTVSCGVDDRLL